MFVGTNGPDDLDLYLDLLILKLVCTSHLRWQYSDGGLLTGAKFRLSTFLPKLGMLSLSVLELFAMYATDGQTGGRTDKSNAYCPLPYGRGYNKRLRAKRQHPVVGAGQDLLSPPPLIWSDLLWAGWYSAGSKKPGVLCCTKRIKGQ